EPVQTDPLLAERIDQICLQRAKLGTGEGSQCNPGLIGNDKETVPRALNPPQRRKRPFPNAHPGGIDVVWEVVKQGPVLVQKDGAAGNSGESSHWQGAVFTATRFPASAAR